jgi:predicted house-cleaning noncanonical NTP pyrophosphatase (MazG superfamily)
MSELPKLVRDKIPEIIEDKEGEEAKWKKVSDSKVEQLLREKLVEESKEFEEEGEIAELADLYAVMREYMNRKNISSSDLEEIESEKRQARGGFEDNILLEEVEET